MSKYNNIILIGYRGTGKSVVAEKLVGLTGKISISLDAEIEKQFGAITEIVEKSGWEKFREIETEMIESLEIENGIIDCGGGVIEKSENVNVLKEKGVIFWLKADLKSIQERLVDKTDRPSLTGEKDFLLEIEEVLKRREPFYRDAADFDIDTNGKTPLAIAEEILSWME